MLKQIAMHELFSEQRQHLEHFFNQLDLDLVEAVFQILRDCEGTIFFTGVGKSGFVAKKIVTTMISTGTKALFLSPTDAMHGDLGIVTDKDVVVMLSKSGESDELLSLVPYLRNKGAQLIAVVSKMTSRLVNACGFAVELPLAKELCPFGLAPIFGDVLAVALMQARNFSLEDYARNHPSGSIGKRITLTVGDLMLTDNDVPLCSPDDKLCDVLVEFSNKRCGCLLVVDGAHRLVGIFTDGDLRRALQNHGSNVLGVMMNELMSRAPKWITPERLAWDALEYMEADKNCLITVLPVLEETRRVVGLIKMHDILQSGL